MASYRVLKISVTTNSTTQYKILRGGGGGGERGLEWGKFGEGKDDWSSYGHETSNPNE